VSGWLAPLGDGDVETTMRYVHIVGEVDEDLGAKLDEYLRQFEENDAEATVEDDQDLAPVGDRRKRWTGRRTGVPGDSPSGRFAAVRAIRPDWPKSPINTAIARSEGCRRRDSNPPTRGL
jgi:hypothetical protein